MMMKKMCVGHNIAWVLMLVGALNWGFIGLFEVNLVARLLGGIPMLERLVYVLVGLSAVAMILKHKCTMCMKEQGSAMKGPEAQKM